MPLPPFRLYGLLGCMHCAAAESFLRSKGLPFLMTFANDDVIAAAGVKTVTGKEEYPVLCCTFNKEIIKGFKQEEYDRLAKTFHTLVSAGAFSSPVNQQQSQPESASAPPSSSVAETAP